LPATPPGAPIRSFLRGSCRHSTNSEREHNSAPISVRGPSWPSGRSRGTFHLSLTPDFFAAPACGLNLSLAAEMVALGPVPWANQNSQGSCLARIPLLTFSLNANYRTLVRHTVPQETPNLGPWARPDEVWDSQRALSAKRSAYVNWPHPHPASCLTHHHASSTPPTILPTYVLPCRGATWLTSRQMGRRITHNPPWKSELLGRRRHRNNSKRSGHITSMSSPATLAVPCSA